MQIQEFQFLSDLEKEEAVWANGVFLANYDEGNDICDIYELFDFYVGFCYKLDKHEKAVITAHIYADQLSGMVNLN